MSGLPDYDEALRSALRCVTPLSVVERVPFDTAHGRVLDEPIVADRDLPPFDRAQMDGYAVRAAEVGRIDAWPVIGQVPAGAPADMAVPPEQCVAIATGAALPADVDTVIQHERSDRADPVRFTINEIAAGHAVHPRGADARAGDVLIQPSTMLGAHHIGIIATVGATDVSVMRRPRAIVLSSGDEVQPVGAPVLAHQIRNSNGPMIMNVLARCGADSIAHHHVVDERDATAAAVGAALATGACEVLVTIGGISAGERDHFPAVFDEHRVERSLVGAAIQPGKPIVVGRAPSGTIVVGLPGNPVSALACACLFGWPIVRRLLGLDPEPPWTTATVTAPIKPNPRRRAFRPAQLDAEGGVTVPKWAGSGDLAHTAGTDGLAELPVIEGHVEPGTRVRFLAWP